MFKIWIYFVSLLCLVTLNGCSVGIQGGIAPTSTINLKPELTPTLVPTEVISQVPDTTLSLNSNEIVNPTPNFLCEGVPKPEISKSANSDNVYLSGQFYLCTYDGTQIAFDFDNGNLENSESKNADIELVSSGASIDNRSFYLIQEINGAFVEVSEMKLPTQEYCRQRTTADVRLHLILGSVGAVGCVLTNDGRIAFFQVEQLDPFGQESVKISFVTWNK